MTTSDAIAIGWMFYYAWMACSDPYEVWCDVVRHEVTPGIDWESALDVGIAVMGPIQDEDDREVHQIIQDTANSMCA